MKSLLEKPAQAQYGRKMKRSDYRVIPHRWYTVLALHLSGMKVKEIKEKTGYSESTIYNILDNEEVNAVRQQLLAYYDKEFEALFPEVTDAIRKGLKSEDKYLEAASLWGRMSGKGVASGKTSEGIGITAENVAIMILQQAKQAKDEDEVVEAKIVPHLQVYEASKDE